MLGNIVGSGKCGELLGVNASETMPSHLIIHFLLCTALA